MTFEEARKLHLEEFNQCVSRMRSYLASGYCNDAAPEWKGATEDLGWAIKTLFRLNEAETEANRRHSK